MKTKPLILPKGIQSFEKLRERNCVYVDKTNFLIDLIENENVCFLSRPRRFGKSLTVSTFKAIFSGKKELFKGLYAEEFLNRPDFIPSPVIHLDMSTVAYIKGFDDITESIIYTVLHAADELDVELNNFSLSNILEKLITETAKKYNQKAVLLIDEYDKPYTDFVNKPDMAQKVRDVLRSFYSQIKTSDKHLRFIFITGIAKFTKMGVFSTLNNLVDISLNPKYAEICGYTENEIINYFPEYLEETANYHKITTDELLEKMRYFYNGFSFDYNAQTRLYNPFSTLLFFFDKEFLSYWIETGQSQFMYDFMKTNKLTVEQFRNLPITLDFAKSPGEIESTPPEGFLYQAGYLSLRLGTNKELMLDYPNTEVLNSMSYLLSKNILKNSERDFTRCRIDLLRGLQSDNCEKVVEVFNRLLASIPYDDFKTAAMDNISDNRYKFTVNEWLYRSTILAFLRGCGVVVIAEMHTNLGRSDIVIIHRDKTWVIELKVAYKNESPKEKIEEAKRQIKEKNYAKPFQCSVCIAIAIDDEKRQIADYEAL